MGQPNGGGWSSILRNAEKASAKFGYNEDTGYFGSRLKGKSRDLRTLISDDPIKDARELFRQLSEGGDIVPTDNPHQTLYLLPGGAYVSLRIVTSTEGSPAVEINVKSDKANTKVKSQKIHFIKKGE